MLVSHLGQLHNMRDLSRLKEKALSKALASIRVSMSFLSMGYSSAQISENYLNFPPFPTMTPAGELMLTTSNLLDRKKKNPDTKSSPSPCLPSCLLLLNLGIFQTHGPIWFLGSRRNKGEFLFTTNPSLQLLPALPNPHRSLDLDLKY